MSLYQISRGRSELWRLYVAEQFDSENSSVGLFLAAEARVLNCPVRKVVRSEEAR